MNARGKKIFEFWLFTQRWGGSIVGPCFLFLATTWSITTLSFLHHAQKTTGTIIKLVAHVDGENSLDYYAPVFQFASSDGNIHAVESRIRSRPAGFVIGQSVSVLYQSEEPDNARIKSFMQMWFFPLTFGVCGLLVSLFAAWLWVRYFKKKARPVATQNLTKNQSFNS